jgi:hypothetical protein
MVRRRVTVCCTILLAIDDHDGFSLRILELDGRDGFLSSGSYSP